MSRAPRTTKNQKEFIISFLEENRILCGGKFNPMELPKIGKLWEKLTSRLNEIGPSKTIRQWKDTISEMKTNVRRRARELRYGHNGTGGGPPMKPLTELEERLLALISVLTVEGADLVVAGGTCNENVVATEVQSEIQSEQSSNIQNEETYGEIFYVENIASASSNVLNEIVVEENIIIENGDKENIKLKKTTPKGKRPMKSTRTPRGDRLENALGNHDKTLILFGRSNFAVARSINNLARAINNLAKKNQFSLILKTDQIFVL